MDNKEAIVWLKGIKDNFHGNCTTDTLVPISRCDVQALNLAIKALEESEWIPVTEALPDIALHVLVQLTNGWITIGHYHSTDKWVFIDGTMTIAFPRDTVVAWRYLPKKYESEVTNEQED